MRSDAVKIGYVGLRGYGRRFFELVKDSPYCNIVACCHRDESVAKEFAAAAGCGKIYSDIDSLLCDDELNAVLLPVPNHFHYEYAKKALLAGKNVLVEKPLTNSAREARELAELAMSRRLVLMTGHNHRYSGHILKIKELLDKGIIGKIVAAEFNMGHGGGLKFGPERWRFHWEKCPGGPLNMLGSHLIDTANRIFGNAVNVNGIVKNMYASTTAEDVSLIQLEYESGVVVNIVNLYNSVSTEFINIYGTDGALRFTRWPEEGLYFQPKDINCDAAPYEKIEYPDTNGQRIVFDRFCELVLNRNYKDSNISDSVKVVEIMESLIGGK